MNFIKEFREFAMRGNVVDMAIGVIIGSAFGKIVSSLVSDIFTPVLGILTGGIDFKDMKICISTSTRRCSCCYFKLWFVYSKCD